MTANIPHKSPKGPLPLKAFPAPPKKSYPLAPPSGHDHPYADLLDRNLNRLLADQDNLERKIRELSAENLSLRLLAIHGLIYRLDSLIKDEFAKKYPNAGRVQRWSDEVGRLRISYEMLKKGKHKGGR